MTGDLNVKVGRLSEDKEKILAGPHFSATAATSGKVLWGKVGSLVLKEVRCRKKWSTV